MKIITRCHTARSAYCKNKDRIHIAIKGKYNTEKLKDMFSKEVCKHEFYVLENYWDQAQVVSYYIYNFFTLPDELLDFQHICMYLHLYSTIRSIHKSLKWKPVIHDPKDIVIASNINKWLASIIKVYSPFEYFTNSIVKTWQLRWLFKIMDNTLNCFWTILTSFFGSKNIFILKYMIYNKF